MPDRNPSQPETERLPVNLMLRTETEGRAAVNGGDVVTASSYRCSESPEKAAVAIRRTPRL
jgi:hypothetical protein